MKCRKGGKYLTPEELENLKDLNWWGLNTITCCIPNLAFIGKVLPIPAFTHLYRFFLDLRCHDARSKTDFRTKVVLYEKKIRKHEAIGRKALKNSDIIPIISFLFYNHIIIIICTLILLD